MKSGKHITTIIPPELQDEERTIISRIRSGERIEHFDTIRLGKSGHRIPISLTVS
jgi:PAS domain S-box-containing protein